MITIPLSFKLQCYLQLNNLVGLEPTDYLIVHNQDDGVQSISNWNSEKLGELPTDEVLVAAFEQIQKNRIAIGNKLMAQAKLTQTDWSQYDDVNNTAANPHLLNKEEYDAYRLQLRSILVSPLDSVIEFPTIPKALWSE
jgi:hypothetical protein